MAADTARIRRSSSASKARRGATRLGAAGLDSVDGSQARNEQEESHEQSPMTSTDVSALPKGL